MTPCPERAESANQDIVQARLIQICELVRRDRFGGEPDEATKAWYQSVKLNGLCGGWVEIHKRAPDLIEELWPAIASWQPPESGASLEHLKDHLASSVDVSRHRPVDDAVWLLKLAYQFMDGLEPDAGYGPVPEWLQPVTALPDPPGKSGGRAEIEVDRASAGDAVARKISEMIGKKNFDGVAHIETDAHHMSVRIERNAKGQVMHVVESEKTGVVTCSSWEELGRVLQGGIYLDDKDTRSQKVEIKIYKR